MIEASVHPDALRARRMAVAADRRLIGLDRVTVEPLDVESRPKSKRWRWRLHLAFIPAIARRDVMTQGAGSARKRVVPAKLGAENLRFTVGGRWDARIHVLRIEEPVVSSVPIVIETDSLDGSEAPMLHLDLENLPHVDRFFKSAPIRLADDRGRAVSIALHDTDPSWHAQPVRDYLVKDFEGFRRLMLERMTFEVPRWRERNPSDLGVTVIEALAYAADYLSYFQDAVATEAYIDTARRRESVRRHARLVDYMLDEGTNARVWVQVDVARDSDMAVHSTDPVVLPAGTTFFTYCMHQPTVAIENSHHAKEIRKLEPLVFQSIEEAALVPGHGTLDLYTWGTDRFQVDEGATSATLVGDWPALVPGTVLVFEHARDPIGRHDGEADVRARQAVRLVRSERDHDPLTDTPLTRVSWLDGDALTAAFPVSMVVGGIVRNRLTVARGNMVLADHGAPAEQALPPIEAGAFYRPGLGPVALTFSEAPPDDLTSHPAARTFDQKSWRALPAITLVEHSQRDGLTAAPKYWQPRLDLLRSDRFDRHFVVETGDDRRVWLRFGDGQNGRVPAADIHLIAHFRHGQGPDGNVGVNAIRHVLLPSDQVRSFAEQGIRIEQVCNVLPGAGGRPREETEHARVAAPEWVERLVYEHRCVTAEDFAKAALRNPEVADAGAEVLASGAGPTVIVYVSRTHGRRLDSELRSRLEDELGRRRMLGFEVEIRPPRWVPLEIELRIWIAPGKQPAWQRRFLAGREDSLRLFASNELTFGQDVYLSTFVSQAMSFAGVIDVEALHFRRWGERGVESMASGVIQIDPFEIARLRGDENRPQHGVLRIRAAHAPEAGRAETLGRVNA